MKKPDSKVGVEGR